MAITKEPEVIEANDNPSSTKITNKPIVEAHKSKLSESGISPASSVTSFSDPSSAYQNAIGMKGMIQFYHLPTERRINFKAFVTNFSDNYNSKWNEENVYGRMDPIPVFENTQRRIEIEFDVPASSKQEAVSNLAKIDRLIQCLYPTYEKVNDFNVLSTAPIFRVKFANLISKVNSGNSSAKKGGLICYINGFNFNPDFEPGVIISGSKLYPKTMKVSLSLGVLHEHLPGFTDDKKFGSGAHNFPYGAGSKDDIANANQTGVDPKAAAKNLAKTAQVAAAAAGIAGAASATAAALALQNKTNKALKLLKPVKTN